MLDFSKIEKHAKNILQYLLGSVFLISGISKFVAPDNFIREIDKLVSFPLPFITVIAYLIIVFELILAGLIFFKLNKRTLNLTILTLLLFCCYLGYKVFTHDNSDCGCFGNFIYNSNLSALTQDIFLLIISVYLYE